ncbi:hypothetical protein VB775_12125 [Pseudanabaena sp. CCNP1317]|nr:hypothetical protein [Pseudanabaena sp. CCNP1317]
MDAKVDAKICLDILLGKQSMTTRRTDSAFPVSYNRDTDSLVEGLTKREYFAILLMQAYTNTNTKFEDDYQKARLAVAEADALIDILAYEANPKAL